MPYMNVKALAESVFPVDIFISSHCSKGEFFSIYNKQGR